jgi:UDP-N-acetylmuramoyl-tripeptide--D-alanyl-D-alanine ligase
MRIKDIRDILSNYLWFFARLQLRQFKPQIIAVTGPAGKTSTKEMIYAVLSQSPALKSGLGKSFGNLNTRLGIPLAIFQIQVQEPTPLVWLILVIWLPIKRLLYWLGLIRYPQLLVLEIGADRKGDMAFIAQHIRSQVVVLTSIGAAHLEFFRDVGQLMKEKLILFRALARDGLAVLPEKGLRRDWLDEIAAQKRFFNSQDLKAAARVVGHHFKLTKEEIEKGLKNIQPIKGRFNVITTKRGYTIINDTYNANPVSVESSLELLKKAAAEKKAQRKIAVLADMLELGQEEKKWHRRVGRRVKKQTDLFISFGDLARHYQADVYFDDKKKLREYLLREVRKGDIILVKGSRGMRMESIVEAIKGAESKA